MVTKLLAAVAAFPIAVITATGYAGVLRVHGDRVRMRAAPAGAASE